MLFLIFKVAHLGGLRLGFIMQFGLGNEDYASTYFQKVLNEIFIILKKDVFHTLLQVEFVLLSPCPHLQ